MRMKGKKKKKKEIENRKPEQKTAKRQPNK